MLETPLVHALRLINAVRLRTALRAWIIGMLDALCYMRAECEDAATLVLSIASRVSASGWMCGGELAVRGLGNWRGAFDLALEGGSHWLVWRSAESGLPPPTGARQARAAMAHAI